MLKPNDLDTIFIKMKIITEERLKELRMEYKSENSKFSFNRFLINLKEITHEQLRVALLRQKSTFGE